jgi:diguanylate cyclase (GGDEF)-like protein
MVEALGGSGVVCHVFHGCIQAMAGFDAVYCEVSVKVPPSILSGPEPAITTVRWALCVLAILANGALTIARLDAAAVWAAFAASGGLLAGCAVIGALASRSSGRRLLLVQVLDTGWWVGLVIFSAELAPGAAWAVLAMPIVAASVRGSEIHVLSAWFVAAVSYLAVGHWIPSLVSDTDNALNAMGMLLAVAAGVAVLTRWLAQGWADQRALTETTDERLKWVINTQDAVRAMRGRTPEEIVSICLQTMVQYGYGAATATGVYDNTAGATELITPFRRVAMPSDATIEISTHDLAKTQTVYSTACVESHSQTLIVGWTTSIPSDALATAMGDLVAQTSIALETTTHLATAQFDATHDALTKLANRRQLGATLTEAVKGGQPSAVIFIDLDKFKLVNDLHGHEVGDEVLRTLADRISTAVGDLGTAIRYGGDEFVVALVGAKVDEAANLAQIIRRLLRGPVTINGRAHELSASIGVATATHVFEPDELVQHADRQAYVAKRAGGDRVVVDVHTSSPHFSNKVQLDATSSS